jgi:hypothetical protein
MVALGTANNALAKMSLTQYLAEVTSHDLVYPDFLSSSSIAWVFDYGCVVAICSSRLLPPASLRNMDGRSVERDVFRDACGLTHFCKNNGVVTFLCCRF